MISSPWRWALFAAGFAVLVSLLLALVVGGPTIYALDDPYINFSLARSLWQTGHLAIDPTEPTAGTSSPLWTLLLVPGAATGNLWVLVALTTALNAVALWILCMAAGGILRALGVDGRAGTLAMIACLTLLPAIPLMAIGMEHLAHAALGVLLCALCFSGSDEETAARRREWAAAAVAFALAGLRYESAFLLIGVGIVLLAARRFRLLALLFAGSLLGLCTFGMFLLATSGQFLSNSALAKAITGLEPAGPMAWVADRGARLAGNLLNPFLLPLVTANVALLGWQGGGDMRRGMLARRLATVFLVATVLHAALAAVGWMERYEAYLLAVGMLPVIGWAVHAARSAAPLPRWPVHAAAVLLILFAGHKKLDATRLAFVVPRGITGQQVEVGRFLRVYTGSPDAPIAMNDVGAASWFSERPILDLWGLASNEVRRVRFTPMPMQSLKDILARRDVRVVVIYDDWFHPNFTRDMILVGQWETQPAEIILPVVSFYATTPGEAAILRTALLEHAPRLPAQTRLVYLSDFGS